MEIWIWAAGRCLMSSVQAQDRSGYAYANQADLAKVQVVGFLDGIVERGPHLQHAFKEYRPGGRQRHAFGIAFEELYSQFLLQALHPLGQRRLTLAELLRSASHVACLCHVQKIIQILKPHLIPPRYRN